MNISNKCLLSFLAVFVFQLVFVVEALCDDPSSCASSAGRLSYAAQEYESAYDRYQTAKGDYEISCGSFGFQKDDEMACGEWGYVRTEVEDAIREYESAKSDVETYVSSVESYCPGTQSSMFIQAAKKLIGENKKLKAEIEKLKKAQKK